MTHDPVTLPFQYVEVSQADFLAGERYALAAVNAEGALAIPEEVGMDWGPATLGVHEDEEEFDRVWVVYTTPAEEVYLVCSGKHLQRWIYKEQLVYVPSGNFNPSIAFAKTGHYTIATEFVPAGTDPPHEVWVMEPPYAGEAIRRIAYGKYPRIVSEYSHDRFYLELLQEGVDNNTLYHKRRRVGNLLVFYVSNDQETLYYRSEDEGYDTEHEVPLTPEGEKRLLATYKNKIPIGPEEAEFRDLGGHLAPFYRTEDDGVIHYINSDMLEKFDRLLVAEETTEMALGAEDIGWDDMRYVVDVLVLDAQGEPVEDVAVTLHAQRDQAEVTMYTDGTGQTTVQVLPYDTVYDITLSHATLGEETDWGVLIYGHDVEKYMSIELVYLEGRNKPDETMQVGSLGFSGIEWELRGFDVDLLIQDSSGAPLSDCTVTVHGMYAQETVVLTTAGDGTCDTFLVPYEEPYQITLEHATEGVDESWGIVVQDHMSATLRYVAPKEEWMSIVELDFLGIEWEDLRYQLDITVTEADGTPIEDATVTFHAQRDQAEVYGETDVNGEVQLMALPYDTVYEVTIDHATHGVEDRWRVLVYGEDVTKQMDIALPYLEGRPDRDEMLVIGSITLASILWVEV